MHPKMQNVVQKLLKTIETAVTLLVIFNVSPYKIIRLANVILAFTFSLFFAIMKLYCS